MSFDASKIPIFLDCKVEAIGSFNSGAGITTWTFPNARPYDTMVYKPTGVVWNPLGYNPAQAQFTAPGNFSGGVAVLGRAYPCEVLLSEPFVRDSDGNAIISGSMTARRLIVRHKDAISYTIEVYPSGRSVVTKTHYDEAGAGTFGLHKHGAEQVTMLGNTQDVLVYLKNSSPFPATWTGVEWECVFQNLPRI